MVQKLELNWVGKDAQKPVEPRILLLDAEKSKSVESISLLDNVTFNNYLIHGDNLLALKAIEKKFANSIKLVFIDPPFNTGAAFEHYNDNIEHSIWIDLMYQRLNILHKLLSNDGVIAVEIDDSEMPYLRVIMDEIFGRDHFVAQINVKSNNLSGNKTAHKEKTILRNKDNIIVYKKGDEIKVNPQYVERTRWDTHYNLFGIYNEGRLVGFKKMKDVLIESGILGEKETIKEEILSNKDFYKFILENKFNICRPVNSMPAEMKKISKSRPGEIIPYNDENGKIRYAFNGNRISFLESSVMTIDGEEKFVQLLGDFWSDIDFQNTQNEGGVSFPASKKPEALIRRILELFTNKGDWVLDSFLGSGTTSAVAQKMGRQWIGIEMGDHAYSHCKVRIDNVISGNDKSGITDVVDYKGGGGYNFYELAPTLINFDEIGEPIINKAYSAEMLASSVALHEGFKYDPDKVVFWKQSKSNENAFLFVTTKHVDVNMIKQIESQMASDEFLVVACKSFDKSATNISSKIKIKKIPQMLLGKCEFEKNDYSLNIINPPVYEDEEE